MRELQQKQVIIVDAGGQYCHLIARRVRDLGVQSRICSPSDVLHQLSASVRGVIISGGPDSVYAPESPRVPVGLFEANVPILGICYGHQLIASTLGGTVRAGAHHEYGEATLRIVGHDTILRGVPDREKVWMSHGDEVLEVPPRFKVLARSETCQVAAMADTERAFFGVQFHPEVTDTACGRQVLQNFLFTACHCERDWDSSQVLSRLEREIREYVGQRHVLFFVSGGVDSTVAFTLCTDALGPDRVTGVFVDTGLMRKGERAEIERVFAERGWHNFRSVDASKLFLEKLGSEHDPERKRRIIGDAFLQVQRDLEVELSLDTRGWMLGQGTIYPDTIESGFSDKAAVIKTHHNRVPAIAKLIQRGLVLEPLKEFYKDEVRDIGRQLGLPEELVSKQPFPGPGLAVRCLCSVEDKAVEHDSRLDEIALASGLQAWSVPLRTVGVQGDHRSYTKLVVLVGDSSLETYAAVARSMTRQVRGTNRVAFQAVPGTDLVRHSRVCKSLINRDRLDLLREVDSISHDMLHAEGLWADVWQFPVVLLPLTVRGGQTVALRPVSSSDAMTARHANLPLEFIQRLARRLMTVSGVDLVLYDVTDKPPATIEWE